MEKANMKLVWRCLYVSISILMLGSFIVLPMNQALAAGGEPVDITQTAYSESGRILGANYPGTNEIGMQFYNLPAMTIETYTVWMASASENITGTDITCVKLATLDE
jgi:hypothetical protein